ncbi:MULTISPECIES: DUF4145 domain-containing protein [Shewanella]|uniref:DUF4145 domain-containing protein n=1 Tax=Shewanella TaxID=22 RepID=UPI000F81B217|nr:MULTISPECIES: DUF4145 domain-containing protein [Shewanella]WAL78184.1 hypothetical protein OX890_18945 [Shewanella sp. DAU305]
MNKLIVKRFEELDNQMIELAKTVKKTHYEMMSPSEDVDSEKFLEWRVKVKNLIIKVCGDKSEHYKEFQNAENNSSFSGNFSSFKYTRAVFLALKEDFLGGYLSSYKSIVQAEVFETELEQARELLSAGYSAPAAIIAGVVLETSLRELCSRENIAHGKMDKMNADLTKSGVYNSIVQKKITSFAGIRNSAAHGKPSEFSKADVEQMIVGIEDFLTTNLNT